MDKGSKASQRNSGKRTKLEIRILEVSRENRRISLGLRQVSDDPWPELVEYFESGKEVSGEIIRILDKGIVILLERDVEGIIPFGKMSKKDRRNLASQYEVGANLSGIIMKVSAEDKKVILYKEELAGTVKRTSAMMKSNNTLLIKAQTQVKN